MNRKEALAAVGLPADSKCVWPTCGCSDDDDDPECGGTGEADTCKGPRHPALLALGPREHLEDPGDFDGCREWVLDEPCRCPCHGGSQ